MCLGPEAKWSGMAYLYSRLLDSKTRVSRGLPTGNGHYNNLTAKAPKHAQQLLGYSII